MDAIRNRLNQDVHERQLKAVKHRQENEPSPETSPFPLRKRKKLDQLSPQTCLQEPAIAKHVMVTHRPVPPGIPPAVWACAKNDRESIKALIAQGVDLEYNANGRYDPPIHQAINSLNFEMVQLLLANGASLETEDLGFFTVLQAAKALGEVYDSETANKMVGIIEAEAARRARI